MKEGYAILKFVWRMSLAYFRLLVISICFRRRKIPFDVLTIPRENFSSLLYSLVAKLWAY